MMNTKSKDIGYYYEKFKAFLLVFLMLLCMVQVGILWSSQSGSFPISFLSTFFPGSKTTTQFSIEDSKSDYLLPHRVAISTGFDGEHYIIPNASTAYNTLWNGAKLYLSQALGTRPKQTQLFSEDAWGTLVAKKPYSFEFNTQIPIDIIKWVLNLKISDGEGLSSVYKIVICPDDPDNGYSDTLYIRDDKYIYTYDVPNIKGNALSKDEFKSIYTKQQSNANAKNYKMAIEIFINSPISQDLLLPFTKSTERYADITCIPFPGLDVQTYSISDYDEIAKELFGQDRNDYDPDVDVNGSAVFKKKDSVYRLYKNSIVEYKFTGNQGTIEKPKVLEAYKKAIGFIMESNFRSDLSIYLKSIKEGQNSYIFNFDYAISLGDENGEMPILLKNYEIPNSSNQVDSSISIEASSKRVLHCEWVALSFKVGKSLESYDWTFADMHAKVLKAYTELAKKELYAKDFGIYYVLTNPKIQDHIITPSFVLFTKDGSYDIPMKGNNK